MAYIARTQGFDSLPALAGPEEIDALVTTDRPELFRGVRDSRYAEEFTTGRYLPAIPSSSSFGVGIYTSTDREVALGYADDRSEGVTRMVLRPSARTVDLAGLRAEMNAAITALDEEKQMLAAGEQTPAVRSRLGDLSVRREILSDEGRFAAVRGYDAYYVREPGTADIWVILNRSAVVVEAAHEAAAGAKTQADSPSAGRPARSTPAAAPVDDQTNDDDDDTGGTATSPPDPNPKPPTSGPTAGPETTGSDEQPANGGHKAAPATPGGSDTPPPSDG